MKRRKPTTSPPDRTTRSLDPTTPRLSHGKADRTSTSSYGVTPKAGNKSHTTPHHSRSQRRFSRRSFKLESQLGIESEYASDYSSDCGDVPLLDAIIGTSWKIHQVSPLYNLQLQTSHLKQYSKYTRETLSCLAMNRGQNVEYHAYFTWFGRLTEHDKFESLQVEVKTTSGGLPAKTSYCGFLLSPEPLAPSKQFLHLPLLLCRGTSKVMIQSVHDVLHNLFDCVISQLHIPQLELRWLSAMLNGDQEKPKHPCDVAKFRYRICANNDTDIFTVCVPTGVLQELWERVHKPSSIVVEDEEVTSFHDALHRHMRQTMFVDLQSCVFVRFSLPALTMDSDGSLKMFTKYSAVQTLKFMKTLTTSFENLRLTWV